MEGTLPLTEPPRKTPEEEMLESAKFLVPIPMPLEPNEKGKRWLLEKFKWDLHNPRNGRSIHGFLPLLLRGAPLGYLFLSVEKRAKEVIKPTGRNLKEMVEGELPTLAAMVFKGTPAEGVALQALQGNDVGRKIARAAIYDHLSLYATSFLTYGATVFLKYWVSYKAIKTLIPDFFSSAQPLWFKMVAWTSWALGAGYAAHILGLITSTAAAIGMANLIVALKERD